MAIIAESDLAAPLSAALRTDREVPGVHPLDDVEVLASYPPSQGVTLHSLAAPVVYPCSKCEHLRDSCNGRHQHSRATAAVPGCYADLISDAM